VTAFGERGGMLRFLFRSIDGFAGANGAALLVEMFSLETLARLRRSPMPATANGIFSLGISLWVTGRRAYQKTLQKTRFAAATKSNTSDVGFDVPNND